MEAHLLGVILPQLSVPLWPGNFLQNSIIDFVLLYSSRILLWNPFFSLSALLCYCSPLNWSAVSELQGNASIQITSISPASCRMARASCIILAVPAIFLQACSVQALSGQHSNLGTGFLARLQSTEVSRYWLWVPNSLERLMGQW